MTSISLVMATLGRTVEIDRCVDSLVSQTFKNFELIVVDQNPDDRLVAVVMRARALGIDCKHIRQAEPNLCMARNAGIAEAKAELIAFPDDDCWYESESLARVLDQFSRNTKLDGLVICWCETGERPQGLLLLDNFRQLKKIGASSITLFFRRECLQREGGFDFSFGLHSWYGSAEETDLLLRILSNGGIMEYAPNIFVHHAIHKPARLSVRKSFLHACSRSRGTGALYARHRFSVWVVAKGLVSPWVRILKNLASPSQMAYEVGKWVGLLQGFLGWHFGFAGAKSKSPTDRLLK